jgi:DNA-binding beta-propeller fold protein YncE
VTLQVVHSFSYDAGVRPFVFSPDGSRAFVQFSYFSGFREISTATGDITRTKNLPVMGPQTTMQPSDYPNQAAHHGIALSGDGKTICAAATVANYVALVARSTLATKKIVQVGDQPAEVETSDDGKYCFVSERGPASNALSVISYAKQRKIATLKMGRRPQEQAQSDVPDAILRKAGFKLPRAATQKKRAPARRRRSP